MNIVLNFKKYMDTLALASHFLPRQIDTMSTKGQPISPRPKSPFIYDVAEARYIGNYSLLLGASHEVSPCSLISRQPRPVRNPG